MRPRTRFASWLVALSLGLVAVTFAQAGGGWSDDPAENLSVADGAGDQILPKLAYDFRTWVSWFDGIGTGYDVRVQVLEFDGTALLPHNGVLVADRSFSSVQDYGLDVDLTTGRAVLAFRDDRFTGTQITAASVARDGTLVWGANGVQLTNTTAFVASPKIASIFDDGIVVAWTEGSSTRLQKLDVNGVPQWPGDVVLTPAAGSYSVSDLHATTGAVVLSIVHQTGGFGSPRHILAQKFDTNGNALWGATPVAVFDGGSIQLGNFPPFTMDEWGGATFAWYSTSPLSCFVQRLLPDGTEAFPHNGVSVSTNTSRVRVSPTAVADGFSGDVYAFWEEKDSLQSQSGLYGQKVDSSGNRLTPEGIEIVALGATQITQIRSTISGTFGAHVYWNGAASFGQDRLFGAHLDPSGAIDLAPFDISSTPSGKSRLVVAPALGLAFPTSRGLPADGYSVLAWSDGRTDGGDIFAQPVRWDGYLGVPVSSGAAPIDLPASGFRLAVHPNPLRGSTRIDYAVPLEGSIALALAIHDVTGRLVRSFPTSAPNGSIAWDGTDSAGTPVAAGVYFVRLGANGDGATRTLTVVR
jgi:hypothetical protein